MTKQTLDHEYLRQLAALQQAGGPDPVDEVIRIFRQTALARLGHMEALLAEDRHEDLAREAHAMRSSAGSVGALALGDLCRILEECAAGRGPARDVPGVFERLRREVATVERELVRREGFHEENQPKKPG